MGVWRVAFEGRGYRLERAGVIEDVGFFVNRFALAETADEAEQTALSALWRELADREVPAGGHARVRMTGCAEIEAAPRVLPNFSWFPDQGDSDPES